MSPHETPSAGLHHRPRAFLAGPAGRRWWGHFQPGRAGTQAPAAPAVLLCGPHGQEGVRAHRLMRVLADRLSRSGVDVLRFDPFGSGDADGRDEDLGWEGWQADVIAAGQELARLSPGRRQVWIGFRLGATAAWLSAARLAPGARPAGLVLCEAVRDGLVWLHGLAQATVSALEASYSIRQPAWRHALQVDPLGLAAEGLGFAIGPALLEPLKRLRADELPALDDVRVQHITPDPDAHGQLVDYRFDWTAEEALNTAIVPQQLLQALLEAVGQVGTRAGPGAPPSGWPVPAVAPSSPPWAPTLNPPAADRSGADLAPQAVWSLGREAHLVATWTPPTAPARGLQVLWLNAGVIHRVGPHRLHVKLSRALAAQGFGSLRFDFSGQGDSQSPQDPLDFQAQAVQDVRDALDALQARTGCRRFVLAGVCSGAAHAQAAALADERVQGVFLIDGFAYGSFKGRLHFAWRALQAYGLRGFSQRVARHWQRRLQRDAAPAAPSAGEDELVRSVQEFDRDMAQLTQRGVDVTLLFTGSVLEHFGHARQLHDTFGGAPWLTQVRCLFEPEVDHTFTRPQAQALLQDRILQTLLQLDDAVKA